jgi:hypothetical protein
MIKEKEFEKERSVLGLRQFVLRRKRKISSIAEERDKGILKKGIYKEFLEELIPLSLFCLKNYKKNFRISPKLGNQGFDAVVKDKDGNFIENIELTFPHDGRFEAEDARKVVNANIGNFRKYNNGEDLCDLKRYIIDTCKSKSQKIYTDCSLVIILSLIPPDPEKEKIYNKILEDIISEIKYNFQFKAKNVYILFTPFKKIIKIG